MGTPSVVGHLDADCFYVSSERVRSPCLHRLPVAVLGNQGACVIAKSYEMKALGITTGMPVWEAVRRCPEGVYVKRDFRWYEAISRQILDILRALSPAVEYHSIDEMFFDATALPQAFNAPLPHAVEALQQRVLREARVPASVGVSLSKTLAKLASDPSKPFGCRVLLDRGDIETFLAGRPVEEVAGIGERSRRKLARHGILTCLDFAQADRRFVRKLLTIRGEALWWELNGTPARPILTERPAHKCFSRGGSLGEATANPERLTAWAVRNVERLVEELDHHRTFTDRLTLVLGFKEGGGWSGRTALPETTARFDLLVDAAKHLLAKGCRGRRRVCRMHLLLDRLSRRPVQGSLFPCPNPVAQRVAFVKRFVNERVGRFAVRSGDTLPLADIYRDEATGYDICDVRGKFCF
jgi:nucleotidyltransferase/DNA polymerase involved in DNA repair